MSKEDVSSDGQKERIINFDSESDEEPDKPEIKQYDLNHYESDSDVKGILICLCLYHTNQNLLSFLLI